jgi:hypothetical protein
MTKTLRRATDRGMLCWIALRISQAWDFIDDRQVIRRAAFLWMLYLTGVLLHWSIDYAWHSKQEGTHIAAVIAAVWTPWTLLQGAIFKFYDQAQEVRGRLKLERQTNT